MKFLFINKFLHPNGGSETYIFKLGEFLKSQGHEVEYFGMDHPDRIVGNSLDIYTSNMDFHEGSKFAKLVYPIKTIYSREARKKLRAVLNDFNPDVCHLNNFNYQLTPSVILEIDSWRRKNKNSCKLIFTAHDYQLVCPNHMCNNPNTLENCEKCLSGSFINCTKGKCIHGSTLKSFIGTCESVFWKLNGVYNKIDKIICCSEFLKSKMDTNPVFAGKTVALHNFIDKSVSDFLPDEKKDYVLYFGRYSQEKGIMPLIEVCKQLPDINFIFAGTGPLENELAGIPNVTNIGFQTGDALKKYISQARFTVYPSQWYENCPFSVMESQLYGTPVLGADIGGIPELIRDSETGELFPAADVDVLKAKIEKLWNNKNLTDEYSANCKSIEFDSVEEYVAKLANICGIEFED